MCVCVCVCVYMKSTGFHSTESVNFSEENFVDRCFIQSLTHFICHTHKHTHIYIRVSSLTFPSSPGTYLYLQLPIVNKSAPIDYTES